MLDRAETDGGSRQSQAVRREQLIDATIKVIAEQGLSNVTLGKVGAEVGLTAGMINFHFKSKQELLTATLRSVADDYAERCDQAITAANGNPSAGLLGLIDVSFDPAVCEPKRVSVWYAFWGESQARGDYLSICGGADESFLSTIVRLMTELNCSTDRKININAAAKGLAGLVDALWQDVLVDAETFDRSACVETCKSYLSNLFPKFSDVALPRNGASDHAIPDSLTGGLPRTLPASAYCSQDNFQREMETIHKRAWQIICHVSDIPDAGDYFTFEGLGERAFVIRGEDHVVRAFHNSCPHRAHAVVSGLSGNSAEPVRCPYHAWAFNYRGDLTAIAAKKAFPPFDSGAFGLKALDCEIYNGFVFIRFAGNGPPVAERYAPHDSEFAPYRFADMVPIAPFYDEAINADWKNVWDNYLEDYHFPTGHPGLFGLMSPAFDREPDDESRTIRLSHAMRAKAKGGWSSRAYHSLLPDQSHLPENQQRRWSYFFMYPCVSLDVYPNLVDFFHIVPTGPGTCRLRVGMYGLPDADRAVRATRYLSGRINWQVHHEDTALIESVQGGLASSGYDMGLLGAKEVATRALQRWVQEDTQGV